jgi:hypothetical protein
MVAGHRLFDAHDPAPDEFGHVGRGDAGAVDRTLVALESFAGVPVVRARISRVSSARHSCA